MKLNAIEKKVLTHCVVSITVMIGILIWQPQPEDNWLIHRFCVWAFLFAGISSMILCTAIIAAKR